MRRFGSMAAVAMTMLAVACGGGGGNGGRHAHAGGEPPPAGPGPGANPGHGGDHDHGPGPGPQGNERREERRDDAKDKRVEDRTGWDKLGERMVDGKVDRDVIAVGKADGRFSRIMLVVEHSALEMFDVEVFFGDGSKFSPPTRLVFGKESASRVIDLPGDKRVVTKVAFKYGNLPGGGRAQIELWGK